MGRIVHSWVAVEDVVLILCYKNTCHSWQRANGFHRHLNVKLFPLHLLITMKIIYLANLLLLFSLTYCFSTVTQVILDPSLWHFPSHVCVAIYRFYLLALSTQQTCTWSILLMTNTKNGAKLKKISSTGLLVMSVDIQVSGHRIFASSKMESSSSSFWILQLFWEKNKTKQKVNHANMKAPWGQR